MAIVPAAVTAASAATSPKTMRVVTTAESKAVPVGSSSFWTASVANGLGLASCVGLQQVQRCRCGFGIGCSALRFRMAGIGALGERWACLESGPPSRPRPFARQGCRGFVSPSSLGSQPGLLYRFASSRSAFLNSSSQGCQVQPRSAPSSLVVKWPGARPAAHTAPSACSEMRHGSPGRVRKLAWQRACPGALVHCSERARGL